MPMTTKCQKNKKKMKINDIQHDDKFWYLRPFYNGVFSIASRNLLQNLAILLLNIIDFA
jgi:hypothetical protein